MDLVGQLRSSILFTPIFGFKSERVTYLYVEKAYLPMGSNFV